MMEIAFDGHMPAQRQATLSQPQLFSLYEAMKYELLSHVTYSSLSENEYSIFPHDKNICDLCKAHGVDFRYKKDRIAFFTAVLEKMENPYA
jgi:hypothetical protein